MWAIVIPGSRGPWINGRTVSYTRRQAIRAWLGFWDADNFPEGASWRYWYRRGYRAVKVTVSPTEAP